MHTRSIISIPNIGMLSVTPKTYHFLDEFHTSFLTVWIKQIKADMKVRKRLYNKAKRSKLQHDWDANHKMKNSINTKLKEAYNNYYKRLFDNSFNGNRQQFWKYIKAKCQDKHCEKGGI